jgi:hypothetical protein
MISLYRSAAIQMESMILFATDIAKQGHIHQFDDILAASGAGISNLRRGT